MTTPEELKVRLDVAGYEVPSTSVEFAIAVYQAASAFADEYTAVKDAAKKLISDVMEETGETRYDTPAGTVNMSAPSFVVSYDAKAIDILLRDDADLAMRLSPYRKETIRTGAMRITGTKMKSDHGVCPNRNGAGVKAYEDGILRPCPACAGSGTLK